VATGILIFNSDDVTLTGNSVSETQGGIYVQGGHCEVQGNTIFDTLIFDGLALAGQTQIDITNAAHKLETTSEVLQTSVLSPIRRVRAIVQALGAGLNFLRAHRARKKTSLTEVEDEEMFI